MVNKRTAIWDAMASSKCEYENMSPVMNKSITNSCQTNLIWIDITVEKLYNIYVYKT